MTYNEIRDKCRSLVNENKANKTSLAKELGITTTGLRKLLLKSNGAGFDKILSILNKFGFTITINKNNE
jgi:DNA-binding phage protein